MDREFTGFGFEYCSFYPDDVSKVPLLEFGILPFRYIIPFDVELDPAGHILDVGECSLAHNPASHHPAGQFHFQAKRFKRFVVFITIFLQ